MNILQCVTFKVRQQNGGLSIAFSSSCGYHGLRSKFPDVPTDTKFNINQSFRTELKLELSENLTIASLRCFSNALKCKK